MSIYHAIVATLRNQNKDCMTNTRGEILDNRLFDYALHN